MADVSQKYHGHVISLPDFTSEYFSRNDFLDQKEIMQTDADILHNKPLMFLPCYLHEQTLCPTNFGADRTYKIVLIGILKDGRSATVVLSGIFPYFEIRKPHAETQEAFAQKIKNVQDKHNINIILKTTSLAKPLKGYQEHQDVFYRLYFNTKKERAEALLIYEKDNFETYNNQRERYYHLACRDFDVTFSKWALLNKYKSVGGYYKGLNGLVFDLDIRNYKRYTGETTMDIIRDKSLSFTWDIETYSPEMKVPDPERLTDKMFMLCITIQWTTHKNSLLRISFSEFQTNPHPDFLTVVCGDETGIYRGLIHIARSLKPDFIYGFNDSTYDWPWLIKRAKQTPGLLTDLACAFDHTTLNFDINDKFVFERLYRQTHVKYSPTESIDGFALFVHGCTPVDVRTLLMVAESKSEYSSLKFFLEANKLPTKVDMPISKLFEIYKTTVDTTQYNYQLARHLYQSQSPFQAQAQIQSQSLQNFIFDSISSNVNDS